MATEVQTLADLGFESMGELLHLISLVRLERASDFQAFEDWKLMDGSRVGLERILMEQSHNE